MGTDHKRVAVAIPIYKETITDLEKISLLQAVRKLSSYEIFLVKPRSLSLLTYKTIAPSLKFIELDDRYFRSIAGYNELMISPVFYRPFLAFEYVLVYQLDAFVFGDSLDPWCNSDLDYVGAPWINNSVVEKFQRDLSSSRFGLLRAIKKRIDFSTNRTALVGNGGLSLRRVRKFYHLSVILKPVLSILGYHWNEDLVWSIFVPKYYPWFKVAAPNEAIRFSVEAEPENALRLLGGAKPFGTHAWYATPEMLKFWSPYIEAEGYLSKYSEI